MKTRKPKSLRAGVVAGEAGEMPRAPGRPLKFLFGVALLPALWVLGETFFTILGREAIDRAFWRTPEFFWFVAAADFWVLLFFLCPGVMRKLLAVYVFGHELTHAVWAWLLGGRIRSFRASREGGYVVTSRDDVLVVLAPYFYPVYSMAVILEYGLFAWWFDVGPYHPIFFAALGFTWAFHITYTIWMIRVGQPDIAYHGHFFSLVFVALMNLLVMALMLCIASPGISLASFGAELWRNALSWAAWAAGLLSAATSRLSALR
jgi:hypothetical protein